MKDTWKLLIFITLFITGCASTPTYKDPNVVYIDELKVSSREEATNVGIFADKKFEYNIEQKTDPDRLIVDIDNADSTYTIMPKVPEDDLVLESVTKEQTFNPKGLPVTRLTLNLRAPYPFEATQTNYGARVEISSKETEAAISEA